MANDAEFINLGKALDSFRDVILTDYNLFETAEEKAKFFDLVTGKIRTFISENADANREMWEKVADSRAKAYTNHVQSLVAKEISLCPPGFREENGICVPI